jgi:hypothetical protein
MSKTSYRIPLIVFLWWFRNGKVATNLMFRQVPRRLCGLSKARPISCSDCPAFQRLRISVLCPEESLDRFASLINTILKHKVC